MKEEPVIRHRPRKSLLFQQPSAFPSGAKATSGSCKNPERCGNVTYGTCARRQRGGAGKVSTRLLTQTASGRGHHQRAFTSKYILAAGAFHVRAALTRSSVFPPRLLLVFNGRNKTPFTVIPARQKPCSRAGSAAAPSQASGRGKLGVVIWCSSKMES